MQCCVDVSRPSTSAVSLSRSEANVVRARDGYEYRVLTAWPSEAPPVDGFPVLYLLDANAMFATVVEAIRMRSHRPDATDVTPAVVAGIACATDEPYDRARRRFDYTHPAAGDGTTGGAPAFLQFLEHDVKPLVESAHPVDRSRQTLLGHSLGGRFVLDVLCARPASFQNYVAISPSVWWARDELFADVAALEADASAARTRRVMVTVGEYEQRLAPWQIGQPRAREIEQRRGERGMVDDARAVAARLADVCRQVCFEEFAGEDHASVVPVSLGRALRFCLSPRSTS